MITFFAVFVATFWTSQCYKGIYLHSVHRNNIFHSFSIVSKLQINPEEVSLSSYYKTQKLNQLSKVIGIFAAYFSVTHAATAKEVNENTFIDAVATMLVAKRVMEPTKDYVLNQKYDNARTNIQYILNQLQLQKKVDVLVQNSIDFVDDMDAIEIAQEAGSRVTNTAIQYDSTVYTCVFIPSDDGTVPPSAEKYRTQAYNFYKAFNDDIDLIIAVANDKQLSSAKVNVENQIKSLPKALFK